MRKLLTFVHNTNRAVGMSIRYYPKLTFGLFAVTILGSIIPLLQANILGQIINQLTEALSHSVSQTTLLSLVALYAGIWAIIRIDGVLELYLTKLWRDGAQHAFELTILKKRTEIDLGHYENPSFQNLLLRAFSQGVGGPMIDVVSNQFVIVANIATIIISSIITSAFGWNIYLIIVITAIPSLIVQAKYGHKVWGIWAEHSERQKRYASMRSQILGRIGITQVKLLQNGKRLLEIIDDALQSFRKDNKTLDTERFLYQSAGAIISAAGFGFSLWLLVGKAVDGGITVGQLVFVVSALGTLVGAFNGLLARIATQVEKNLYLNDIFEVLDTKPFITRQEHPVHLRLTEPPKIEFQNVWFKYEGREDWILKGVNLTIMPREKVALVGMNGAGKTTIIKLISRIYDPNQGKILINGVDLKETDLTEWNSTLSILLQDYHNYELPIKESIAMSRSDEPINMEKVIKASKHSGASEFIETWKNGYDQPLGKEFEGGIEPSKGQNQKIALARTIYRNSFIMILDEPTAAIDALSEMMIFEAMENAVDNNTLIVITHRFNTTQSLDNIIVLDHGTVVETGNHATLLAHGGLYKEMFESQAKAFRDTP